MIRIDDLESVRSPGRTGMTEGKAALNIDGPGTMSRRNLMKCLAGLAGAAALPGTVSAMGHEVLRVAIAAEIGNLDLLQNVSPLHTYSLVLEPLIRYGENGEARARARREAGRYRRTARPSPLRCDRA